MKKYFILGCTFFMFNVMAFSQNNNLAGTTWFTRSGILQEHIEFVNETTFFMRVAAGQWFDYGSYRINGNKINLTFLEKRRNLFETVEKYDDAIQEWRIEGNKLYNHRGNAYELHNISLKHAVIVSDKTLNTDMINGIMSDYLKEVANNISVITMEANANTIFSMIIEISNNGNDMDFAKPVNGNNKPHILAWQVVNMYAEQKKLNLHNNRRFANYISYNGHTYILIRIY